MQDPHVPTFISSEVLSHVNYLIAGRYRNYLCTYLLPQYIQRRSDSGLENRPRSPVPSLACTEGIFLATTTTAKHVLRGSLIQSKHQTNIISYDIFYVYVQSQKMLH
jgi:hypothetical protein